MELDWQNKFHDIKDRVLYLLQSEKWSDCHFLVGAPPNQRLLAGHQLVLAMASPVFERMFYGDLADKRDPILIPDVDPDAFHAMLEYIYTDCININSFDEACGLYYVAKKYMLPHVAEECTHFLWAALCRQNACRAYELANLFDDSRLMKSSMNIIATNTREVLADPSFTDIEVSTLMAILDQDRLNIDSELDLFNALLKYATERGLFSDDEANTVPQPNAVDLHKEEAPVMNSSMDPQRVVMDEVTLRQALKKIRFLTLTPQQFVEGPARSKLLQQHEVLAIFMNISSPTVNVWPLPEGLCSSRSSRVYSQQNALPQTSSYYNYGNESICKCSTIMAPDYRNTSITVCSLTFEVSQDLCISGVKVPTQCAALGNKNYTEELSVQIQNMQGSQLIYTRRTPTVSYNSEFVLKLPFKDWVPIKTHQKYKLFVMFYKKGVYPMYKCLKSRFWTVTFNLSESVREGLIREILFVYILFCMKFYCNEHSSV